MAYSDKFIQMGEAARARISPVQPHEVDALLADGALALDIRDKEEHDADHIAGSKHISRGKLEISSSTFISNLPRLMCLEPAIWSISCSSLSRISNANTPSAKRASTSCGCTGEIRARAASPI